MLRRAPALAASLLAVGCSASPSRPGGGSADGLQLVRVAFHVDGSTQYLDVEPLPVAAPGRSLEEKHGAKGALRTYELAGDGGGRSLEVEDVGSGDSAFLGPLRAAALEALEKSMGPPRKALGWHYLALADFLDLPGLAPRILLSRFLQPLAESPSPKPLARRLYASAARFTEPELDPFAGRDEISLRLLPLVRSAVLGSRESLREVLRLSLEYHGEVLLFESAVRAIFPAGSNTDLYARHPEAGDNFAAVAFLNEVLARSGAAAHREGSGWALESQ